MIQYQQFSKYVEYLMEVFPDQQKTMDVPTDNIVEQSKHKKTGREGG